MNPRMSRKYRTSSSGEVNDDNEPANSPLRLNELEEKIKSDPLWSKLWQEFLRGQSRAPALVDAELNYRVGTGYRNILAEFFGPGGIGKSMAALTFDGNIRKRLRKRGIPNPFAYTRNYADTKEVFFKHDGCGDRVTTLMDEDESMTGPQKDIARRAFLNFVKQCRKLGHNLLKCDADRDLGIHKFLSFSIEVWGQVENYLICMFYDRNDTPLGFLKVKYPSKAVRDWYEKIKDKALDKLSKNRGNVGVKQGEEDDANARRIYRETMKKYGSQGIVSREHFSSVAKRLFGGEGYDTCKMLTGMAFTLYRNEKSTQENAKEESIHSPPVAVKHEDGDFIMWAVENYKAINKLQEAKALELAYQGCTDDSIAATLGVYQVKANRMLREMAEGDSGTWFEIWWRNKINDTRKLTLVHNEADAVTSDGKTVYSCKLTMTCRKTVTFNLKRDCAPEIRYCEEHGVPTFKLVLFSVRWRGKTMEAEIDATNIKKQHTFFRRS